MEYLNSGNPYGYVTSTGKNLSDFLKNISIYHRPGTSGRLDLMLNDWVRMAPMLIPQYLEQSPEAQMLFSGEGFQDLVAPQIRSLLTGVRTTAKSTRASLAARGLGRSSLSTALGQEILGRGMEGTASLLSQARLARFNQAVALRSQIANLQAGLTGAAVPAMHRPTKKRSFWKGVLRSGISSAIGGGIGGAIGTIFGNPGQGVSGGLFGSQSMNQQMSGPYGGFF